MENCIMIMENWLMKGSGIKTSFTEEEKYTMTMLSNCYLITIIETFKILSNIGNFIRVILY